MKIIFLAINVNIKARTGDAVHVRELALNLAKLGHHVSLIAGYSQDPPDELQSLKKHPNIQISYSKNLFRIPFPRSKDLSSLWICLMVARRNTADVIYERSFSPKIGVILSKILRKPLIVEINGIVEEESKLQGTYNNHKYTKNIRTKFRQYFLKSANKIVAVTPGIKKDLQKRYNIPSDKIVVIPNGANTDVFRPMDQATAKKELGLIIKNKYVCFVGNLVPWQGVEYLIKAAPIVLKKVPEARFLIVGDGMVLEEWVRMVKKMDLQDKFMFTGSVPFEEVPEYINASDVCVAPFIKDRKCSPIKVFEYLACGKPVILSDIGHDVKLFVGTNSLVIVPPANHKELANAVTKILNDKDIQIMSKTGRDFIIQKYSWLKTAKKVEEICEKS